VFELIDDRTVRESRCRELVRQHGPVCNAKQASQVYVNLRRRTDLLVH
jgi:hypothetical protein